MVPRRSSAVADFPPFVFRHSFSNDPMMCASRNDADTVIFVMEERCKDPEVIVPGADAAKYWKTLKVRLAARSRATARRFRPSLARRIRPSFCADVRTIYLIWVQSIQLLEFLLKNGNDDVLRRCRARLPSHVALLRKYEPHACTPLHRSALASQWSSPGNSQVQDDGPLRPQPGPPRHGP